MKKLFTLLSFIVFFSAVKAQYVNIPDINFRNYLMAKYPSCFNSAKQMDTTCGAVVSEDSLLVNNNSIAILDGVQYFDNLKMLNCGYNYQLASLPFLPPTLIYLNCASNKLTNLLQLPSSLTFLNCDENKLTNLSALPNALTTLYCGSNQLTSLPSLPNSLTILTCNYNKLTSLPNLPSSLTVLYCEGNQLTNLPTLPNSLNTLFCRDNKLIGLPALPNSLTGLYCSLNQLSYLPALPTSLTELLCESNQLTSLPTLPSVLTRLYCDYNQLTSLPALPSSLTELNCFNNPVNCLPKLPAALTSLVIDSASIKCLPNLPANLFIRHSYYPQIFRPICNPTNNAYNCHGFPILQSFFYKDYNSNGKLDAFEKGSKSIKTSLVNDYSYTNTQGTAYLNADSLGTYTITAQAPPLYQVVPPSYTHTFNRYDTIVYDTFALQPLVTKDSLAIEITPINWAARPGFNYAYNVNMENVGTTILNTHCSIVLDTIKFIFDSCSNVNFSFSGNSLLGNFSNVYPAQNINFIVYGRLKTTAVLGSTLTTIATANGGSATTNDTATTNIRGSYDPNDKQATPNLSVAQVGDNNHYIDYTIRFQNTGTDTAFTVVVADTLNASKLQINTLQITGSSHTVKATQNDNVIFFEFRNINLPDKTTNNIGSNGFVNFKVKPKTTLVNGDFVPNTAAIYFDYNTPIITNTAQTNIGSLPLTLLSFSAINKPETNSILLYWNTANELNTSHFIIETSNNVKEFFAVKEMKATGKGNNSYYSSISNSNVKYIRLKMIDRDGKYTYSPIVQLTRNEKQETIVLISLAKGNLKINVQSAELNNTKASIVNNLGKMVKEFLLQQGSMNIDISSLAKGIYYLATKNGNYKFVVE